MAKYKKNIIAIFIFALSFAVFPQSWQFSFALTIAEREAELRRELAEIEKEIALQQDILRNKQRETGSIERDIAILNAKINEAKLTIRAKNIRIGELSENIGEKTETIGGLEEKIIRGKESLAQLIRKTNRLDNYSIQEMVLSSEGISDFFADVGSFDSIKGSLQSLFVEVRNIKGQTEKERSTLDVI